MNIHSHTNLNNWDACGLFPGLFTLFPAHLALGRSSRGSMCPCTAMTRAPKKTSISRSAFFFFFFFKPVRGADDCERSSRFCAEMRQHLSLRTVPMLYDLVEHHFVGAWTTDVIVQRNRKADRVRAGASGDSSPSRAFSRRGTRWLLAFARFSRRGQVTPRLRAFRAGASGDSSPSRASAGASGDSSPSRTFSQGHQVTPRLRALFAQGHQVTPRLRALFRAGASGDSSPSRVFPRRGIIWLTAALRRGGRCTTGKRLSDWSGGSMSPWMSERAESSTHGSRWCGAGIMWMRVFSTHGRPLSGGWYRVNKRAVPNTAAADEGLVSCEWECPLHTADSCRGAGIVWIREQFQTRQPLMRGWYRVNESVLYTRQTAVGGLVSCE